MPPKKRTTATTTPAPMTNAAINALIAQGVADALAEIEANRTSRNGDDNHDSGTSSRRTERVARDALTWWNSHVKTVGHDAAYGMPWKTLKKMMIAKYCLEAKSKCLRLNSGIYKSKGSVMASKPKTMQDAIEFATELMDQKIRSLADRQAKNKRKFDDTSRNNQNQQYPFKRHNVARAYTVRPGEKRVYGGSKPLCPKCNYHHDGLCASKCTNYKRTGHLARDCRRQPAAANNQRAPGANQRGVTCFECRAHGHYKNDCPKLKNKNHGNQAGNGNVVARAYVVGIAGTNPNSNFVTGTFLLNNHYALILFDTGADRSFVSTAFSSLIDIISTTLDHGYDIDLANEMGSFDVIIGIDWLLKYHAIIVCDEKIIRIPFGNEILTVRGDESSNEHESRLNIISCTKTQKYFLKGCYVFLARVTARKAEDKSGEKRLEDVPIV
ncbi:putative reverse transcriptase domain-containing protein [Tanacetum coccineum]